MFENDILYIQKNSVLALLHKVDGERKEGQKEFLSHWLKKSDNVCCYLPCEYICPVTSVTEWALKCWEPEVAEYMCHH